MGKFSLHEIGRDYTCSLLVTRTLILFWDLLVLNHVNIVPEENIALHSRYKVRLNILFLKLWLVVVF